MTIIGTQQDLDRAITALVAIEPRFESVVTRSGFPRLRQMTPTHVSLLRIVTDQLISLKAGAAIWSRIETAIDLNDAASLALMTDAALMQLGLSGAKARTFKAIAHAVIQGQLDMVDLALMSDQAAISRLVSIKGIGPWTADIFLLFALGRADAWPAADLAVQLAAAELFGLAERPTIKHMHQVAEPWRPWRGAAAHLLWSHYRNLKGLEQVQI